MALLDLQHVSRNFDGILAVDDVSFPVQEGETVSVIGPNGAGKTTLFNLITGLDRPTQGEILFSGRNQPPGGRPVRRVRNRPHFPTRARVWQFERARKRSGRRALAAGCAAQRAYR